MDILMPQLGETVAEGKITTWFKAVGDTVAPGDNLFEIETDKVSMEVPAISGGVLAEIRVPAGTVAPVGAVVAVVSGDAVAAGPAPTGASASGAPPVPMAAAPGRASAAAASLPAPSVARSFVASAASSAPLDPFHAVRTPARNYGPARLAGGRTVTPLARRLAAEAGIDLAGLAASGPYGRIVARDVEAAITHGAAGAPSLPASPTADRVKALYEPGIVTELPADQMRKTIAARLVEAKQTVPHFYLTGDVALDRLLTLRHEANAAAPHDADGNPLWRLSVNDLVLRALARALVRVPDANAVWAEDRILRFSRVDVGIAVALDGGLITPVLRDAAGKPMSAVAAEAKDLIARARARRLAPAEYQGGVSTVSNLGMYGIKEFAGIVNPPQSTLLAVGAAERRPVEAADGGVRFETRMTLTLSCDHRVVDGALGAKLLAAVRDAIEHPVGLLV
ncbi:Dihydrolipoyllysine-residue acetyltransferase component of pyruvate dehydrogenase complex [Rhodoplanes serenus]|uniref:Dihydrolipoamide acetyltransferase component of pyruvate dehydrogenase complex n=2 Tax=Rhodoplanes serenus TaxID=200615 RepID=A0A447CND3_9BRAD|nr:dihydrolipoamide acetyltransferase family protein [Rhodoplanes serenus]VCU06663.1 Dihydrolipoyllysine-residue acetyltransferase component of pyruvate dehydrogenase complex [Rhodoplanes serenus]